MSEENNKDKPEIKIPQNKFLWIFGGIILLIVAWFGYNTLISSIEDYKVTLVDVPKQLETGGTAAFTWRVDGPPASISHTSVHMGLESNIGELGKDIKPGDTKYTDMISDFANGTYNVPLQFIGNIKLLKEGKYYFRVHALVKDKNYWSDEFTFNVIKSSGIHKISILYPPKSIILPVLPVDKESTTGGVVTFTWRIDGSPATINHTTIYYGLVSNPGVLASVIRPEDTKYTDFVKDFVSGNYNIPLQFVGNTTIKTAGIYYFRGYTIINGKNYWTDEYSFTAK